MIGRNDPCTCGSEKKYKKCCGSRGTDLVEMLVNEELDRVLIDYFNDYPKGDNRGEMMRLMREWSIRLSGSWEIGNIEEAASEFYLFIHNKEVWRTYVSEQLKQAKRESVATVLQVWDEPFMLLAEITGVEFGMLKVQELFGDNTYHVTRNEGMPTDVGTLMFGAVLRDPRKVADAIAPISSIIFLAKWSKQTKASLVELREAVADKTQEQFIVDHALDIYELFIKRSMASMTEIVEEVLAPTQLSALQAMEATLRDLEQTTESREIMHKLAVAYFMNDNEDVPVEADFLAATVKAGISIGIVHGTGLEDETIVEKYSASSEGMAVYVKGLEALYAEMMNSGDEPMAAQLYDIGTDPKPSEKALWETSMTTAGVVQPERKPSVAEGRAQLLAYEAYAAESEEGRRKLAASALEIGPNNPDALLLQAEIEQDPVVAAELYEKAIHFASSTFEPGENPWQNIPNRPFMRAAFAYGAYLFSEGDYHEAAGVFLDLVKLNWNDNQGARYEAVASLIHAGRYNEAAEIMVRYEKGSQHDATYLYLDWKLELEASKGESAEADGMLKLAAKANSHVINLQTFKSKTIAYPRYQEIQPGSEVEARYIWLLLNGVNR
ncbi:YecA family protein [Sporosarcina sp. YIM B06819]|uniref:YecA family protein n=1 Tax=Sporosarcina sp. YIM B06819 TaxID=3081769 RepID=UPI00298D1CD6|nr:SEC-C metal-binding domain-containing protein [Sporosarcina sp. YIM B06819]